VVELVEVVELRVAYCVIVTVWVNVEKVGIEIVVPVKETLV